MHVILYGSKLFYFVWKLLKGKREFTVKCAFSLYIVHERKLRHVKHCNVFNMSNSVSSTSLRSTQSNIGCFGWKRLRKIVQCTVKLGYNDYGCSKFTAITNKNYKHVWSHLATLLHKYSRLQQFTTDFAFLWAIFSRFELVLEG